MICIIEGCDRAGNFSRGMCGMHYQRWLHTGDAGEAAPRVMPSPTDGLCTIDGCDNLYYGKGYCKRHYYRWYTYGDAMADTPLGGWYSDHPSPAPATWLLTIGEVESFKYFATWRIAQNDAANLRDRAREAADRDRYPWLFDTDTQQTAA